MATSSSAASLHYLESMLFSSSSWIVLHPASNLLYSFTSYIDLDPDVAFYINIDIYIGQFNLQFKSDLLCQLILLSLSLSLSFFPCLSGKGISCSSILHIPRYVTSQSCYRESACCCWPVSGPSSRVSRLLPMSRWSLVLRIATVCRGGTWKSAITIPVLRAVCCRF